MSTDHSSDATAEEFASVMAGQQFATIQDLMKSPAIIDLGADQRSTAESAPSADGSAPLPARR